MWRMRRKHQGQTKQKIACNSRSPDINTFQGSLCCRRIGTYSGRCIHTAPCALPPACASDHPKWLGPRGFRVGPADGGRSPGAQRPRGAPCRPPHAHARTPQPPAPGSPPAAPSPAASSQSAPGEEVVPESSRREQAGTRFPCPPCGRAGGRAPRDAQRPHSGRNPAAPRPHGDRGGASLRPGRRRRKSGPPARPPASRDALRGAT